MLPWAAACDLCHECWLACKEQRHLVCGKFIGGQSNRDRIIVVCDTTCAAIRVTVVVSVGLMFSHDDFAVFSNVKGVTIFTVAGHAVILIVSEIGTGVDGQIGIWQGGGI